MCVCERSALWSHVFRLTAILTGDGSRFELQTTVGNGGYLGNNIAIPGAEICTIPRLRCEGDAGNVWTRIFAVLFC